jgi:hypothetical protein
MSAFDSFRITLPDGDIFEAKGNLLVEFIHQPQYAFDGLGKVASAVDSDNRPNTGDTKLASVATGPITGNRTIEWQFTTGEWDTAAWGSAPADADKITKLCYLEEALARSGMTSDQIGLVEFGEWSEDGAFGPIPVVEAEARFPFDSTEDASSFTGTVDFREVVEIAGDIDIPLA